MIDTVYKTLQTIINKENNGYCSPLEYNILINQIQYDIFKDYFNDENRDKTRQNRGNTNTNYSDLPFFQRQKITQFASFQTLTYDTPNDKYDLPTDLFMIEKNGVYDKDTNRIITEIERGNIQLVTMSMMRPSKYFMFYENYKTHIKTIGHTPDEIGIRYLRKPKEAKWTYIEVNEQPLFNPSATDFQDIELHPSEFSNIVSRLCSLFGINIREQEVVQYAEKSKLDDFQKENN